MPKEQIEGNMDRENGHKQMAETFEGSEDLQIEEGLPDGGWGWVIVFSSFMVHTLTDGIIYTTGIFYVEYLAYFNSSKAETAWVASLLTSVTFIVGPFGSIIVNTFGTIKCTIIGALLAAAGLIISAWAPNIYFLYFSVGICTGVGFGLIYIPAIVSVNSWFDKKRGIAVGIAACGAGIGTFLFSPLTEELVHIYTWKGASILLGAMVLNCCVFGCLFRPVEKHTPKKRKPTIQPLTTKLGSIQEIKNWNNTEEIKLNTFNNEKHSYQINHVNYIPNTQPCASPEDELLTNVTNSKNCLQTQNGIGYLNVRVSSMVSLQVMKKSKKPRCSDFIDVELFKDSTFNIFLLSNFMGSIGFFVPFVYNKDRSLLLGLSEYEASILLSIMGIGNMVGKIVLGFISDRPWCNRLFLFNVCLIVCGGSVIISCFCTTYETLIAYAIVMGITSGAYASLISVILADVLSMDKLTSAFGILSGLGGVACLIGPPLTGWLYDISQSYDVGFYVCGSLITLGGLTLFIPLLRDERLRKPSKKLEVNV